MEDFDYINGTMLLIGTAWFTEYHEVFSTLAHICAIVLSIFGMINYIKKWKRKH